MDKLGIYQIEFHGHCGVTEEERKVGQRLSVDVELTCDLKKGSASDRLEETVDYDRLTGEIVEVGRTSHLHLIETLAEKIAVKILENSKVLSVSVRLKKYPPREALRGGVAVEIRRERS